MNSRRGRKAGLVFSSVCVDMSTFFVASRLLSRKFDDPAFGSLIEMERVGGSEDGIKEREACAMLCSVGVAAPIETSSSLSIDSLSDGSDFENRR